MEPSEQDANISVQANKCVRYFLGFAGSKDPVSKNVIKKNVLVSVGKNFDKIMAVVKHTLLDVSIYLY